MKYESVINKITYRTFQLRNDIETLGKLSKLYKWEKFVSIDTLKE